MIDDIFSGKWIKSSEDSFLRFYETINTDYDLISGLIFKQDDLYCCKVMKMVDWNNPDSDKLQLFIEEFGTLSDAMNFSDTKAAS